MKTAAAIDHPTLSKEEIGEIYRAILSHSPDDPAKAQQGLEAYLAGYNGLMPGKSPRIQA